MKGYNYWSYAPYKPLLWNTGDIYICRIVPYEKGIHFEWLKNDEEKFEIYFRIRDDGEFVLCGSTNKSEFDMSSGYVTDVADIASQYHIYGCEWTPETITLYLDGEAYATYDLTSSEIFTALAEGELLSLALGNGYYNVNSTADTTSPTEYVIDYVRLYQKENTGGLWLSK